MTNEFIENLHQRLFEDERFFKYKGASVDDEKNLRLELLVSHDDYPKLTEELRQKILNESKKLLPASFKVAIDYIIAVHDKSTLIRLLLEYINKERPNFYSLFAAVPIEVEFNNDFLTVTFTMEKFLHEYAVDSGLDKELRTFLDTIVLEESEIVFIETPNSAEKEIKQTEYFADTIRSIPVKVVKAFTRNEFGVVRYIYDIKGKPNASVTVCGKVSGVKSRYIEKIDKTIYSFNLNDTTSTIKVKYFCKPNKNFRWEDVFVDDAMLLINGSIQMDKFDNDLVMSAFRIASCEADFTDVSVKNNFNHEYSDYRFIFPEPCSSIEQDNFFDDHDPNDKLLKNTYCVFDLETTGLNVSTDEIIEIAAIKIVDGAFSEQFSTFVRPTRSIDAKVEELTGIKNEDVALAPQLADVIPDFYKFTKGCILVGHNIIAFDIPLLNSNAAKVKYEFNNDAVDTLMMARNLLGGTKNRLGDVCAKLGVPLIDAHRAINDVTANAKCFLKLIKLEK